MQLSYVCQRTLLWTVPLLYATRRSSAVQRLAQNTSGNVLCLSELYSEINLLRNLKLLVVLLLRVNIPSLNSGSNVLLFLK